jgi:hypothetical protein
MAGLLRKWQQEFSKGMNLIIKVHPNMSQDQIDILLSNFDLTVGNVRVIHRDLDSDVLIWNSNIVMAQESTMLSQSAYMGRPVIVLDPLGRQLENPMTVNRVAPRASSADQLNEIILQLLDKKSDLYGSFLTNQSRMGYCRNGVKNIADLTVRLLDA